MVFGYLWYGFLALRMVDDMTKHYKNQDLGLQFNYDDERVTLTVSSFVIVVARSTPIPFSSC
jgi:hypothetical protein